MHWSGKTSLAEVKNRPSQGGVYLRKSPSGIDGSKCTGLEIGPCLGNNNQATVPAEEVRSDSASERALKTLERCCLLH